VVLAQTLSKDRGADGTDTRPIQPTITEQSRAGGGRVVRGSVDQGRDDDHLRCRVADQMLVVDVANRVVDKVRRSFQNEMLGHGGRNDPRPVVHCTSLQSLLHSGPHGIKIPGELG
jgi:hypothetical protein